MAIPVVLLLCLQWRQFLWSLLCQRVNRTRNLEAIYNLSHHSSSQNNNPNVQSTNQIPIVIQNNNPNVQGILLAPLKLRNSTSRASQQVDGLDNNQGHAPVPRDACRSRFIMNIALCVDWALCRGDRTFHRGSSHCPPWSTHETKRETAEYISLHKSSNATMIAF
jgi:hypothetical protein